MQLPERTLADRLGRRIRGSRSRAYWLSVLALVAIGTLLAVLWPDRRDRPMLTRPSAPRPRFQVVNVTDVSSRQVERLNLAVLVRPGMADESLQAVLNWALYLTLEDYNGRRRHHVRTIWAYAIEDSMLALSHWRAMAIWADPGLPQSLRPAHSGGDAVQVGPVGYDFTNPALGFSVSGSETTARR